MNLPVFAFYIHFDSECGTQILMYVIVDVWIVVKF